MSNDYYVYSNTLLPGQVARAEDVAAEMNGVQSGFNLLPTPRPDGEGFAVPFTIEPAVQDNQAATWGQLKTLEQSAQDAATAAALSETAADQDAIATEADRIAAENSAIAASDSAAAALVSETNAAASADLAAQLTSGARQPQGPYDASGGTYPIASPVAEDAGKYWTISVAGTLPAGAITPGDELVISPDLNYIIVPLASNNLLKHNNLSDLTDVTAARANLDLTTGTGANQIARRDASGNVPGNVAGKALTLDVASETIRGSVVLASPATMRTGTNTTEAATPAGVSAVVPKGAIILWSGSTASVPTGWALCNGTNGTPDLRDRFVVGAGSTYAVGATGGSADAVVVSHNHSASTGSAGNHAHSGSTNTTGSHAHSYSRFEKPGAAIYAANNGGDLMGLAGATTGSAGSHSHSLSINAAGAHTHAVTVNATGESGTNKNLPPYFALAYIMRL